MNFNCDDLPTFKPYAFRAFHEWCCDNGYTPLVVVEVISNQDKLSVPMEYAVNGRIALDLSLQAVKDLEMENDHISFDATFNGVGEHVYLPFGNIEFLIAQEMKQGIAFKNPAETPPSEKKPTGRRKPIFTEVT